MLFPNEPVEQVQVPRSLLPSSPEGEPARSARRRQRDFVRRMRGIAALRHAGRVVEPVFTDDRGAPVPEEQAAPLRAIVEPAVRELADGGAAHARRTLAEIEASRKSDAEQVEDLLATVYRAHAQGHPSREVLDTLLDTFERWLTRDGVRKVDRLFEQVDLDRAPEALGLLLLATTRLTRENFARREAFVERLGRWLVGRSGRSQQDVDNILRGLRT
jgi:hypothetical protein